MYCITLAILMISLAHSASSGAKKCDALGLCTHPSSGAYLDPTTGEVGCPWGMHLVTAPERSDAYIVSTAPYGETGPTSYTPGQYMDIHVITVGPQYMKFLGILMYAVQVSDGLGPEGCPSPGCDGKEEVKLGMWEVTNNMFQVSEPCGGQAITHSNADPKPYHNVFRWKAPEVGSGDVMFRVVIKQGSTNMGHFWWPMTAGDLMLTEGPAESISEWFSGDVSLTCSAICAAQNRECDRSMPTGNLGHYSHHVGKTQSCQLPLLSTCSRTAPSRDEEGYCWFDNQDSGLCDQSRPSTNICDALEVAGGSERLCPCKPLDNDGWVAQSTSAPTAHPSLSPTTDVPSNSPTASNPTSAPTNWFAPRWVEIYRSTTTCLFTPNSYRAFKGDGLFDDCKQHCANNPLCKYFYYRSSAQICVIYDSCEETRETGHGVTVRKDTIPTNEPSFAPSFSAPTTNPTISKPTTTPTTSQPTQLPTVQPSGSPTVSSPTSAPTNWFAPRWVEIYRTTTTCSDNHKLYRAFKGNGLFDDCKQHCANNSRCKYFYYRSPAKVCVLYDSCEETRGSSHGVTVRKDTIPTNEPSFAPSLSAPTTNPTISDPTTTPTTSQPTQQPTVEPSVSPTVSNPSIAPTNWFAPRWVEIYRSTTTCSDDYRISRPFRGDGSYDDCKQSCASNVRCKYFFFRASAQICVIYDSCAETRVSNFGVTVRKDTIPTNEPTFAPSFSAPTSHPTVSYPSKHPTTSEPTALPTISEPSFSPTIAPSTDLPSKMPTTWDTPRWHIEIESQALTCGKSERIFHCHRGCYGQDYCRNLCEEDEACQFYFKALRGRCELFRSCDSRRTKQVPNPGTTWRKELLSGPLDD